MCQKCPRSASTLYAHRAVFPAPSPPFLLSPFFFTQTSSLLFPVLHCLYSPYSLIPIASSFSHPCLLSDSPCCLLSLLYPLPFPATLALSIAYTLPKTLFISCFCMLTVPWANPSWPYQTDWLQWLHNVCDRHICLAGDVNSCSLHCYRAVQ